MGLALHIKMVELTAEVVRKVSNRHNKFNVFSEFCWLNIQHFISLQNVQEEIHVVHQAINVVKVKETATMMDNVRES